LSLIPQPTSASAAPLSIVHLNAYDHHGGAERLVHDLIVTQRAAGHDSLALVGHKTQADSPAISFEIDPDLTRRDEFQRAGWPDYEFRGSHRLVGHPAVEQADVIHAHNLYGGYFHPFSLIALSQFRAVVWTTHDMQAVTGYCSHALDCTRWENGCGQCPDLNRPGPQLAFDNTAALWRDKKLISDNSRLTLVGASSWMVAQLRRSLFGRHPIHLISNGIDLEVFRPSDRQAARQKLGLPPNSLIVGSLARSGVLSHPLKGGLHARATLAALRREHPEMLFLNIGSAEKEPEPWIRSQATDSVESLREMLNALDFFLHPSIADTAPLSVLEAMACGLPVLGFRIGGVPDFVTEREGVLVSAGDTQALIEAARELAANGKLRERLGAAARERAVARFSRSRMAAAYERLYRAAAAAHSGNFAQVDPAAGPHPAKAGLEEIRLTQGKVLGLESKLNELRARRKQEEMQLGELLSNRWLRFGMRLGMVRGAVRSWLHLKHRERLRKTSGELDP